VDRKHEFFAHAVNANLTGEQARVLFRLLACEYDGVMGIRQNTIAEELGLTESNVSRSIKALIDAGLIKRVEDGRQGIPVFQIEKAFCYGPVDKKYRA
jgi:DNA-binding MarR family transcriptional regulator